MQVQHKNIPTPQEIEKKRQQAHVPKDQIALMQQKNQLSEETPKMPSELSEERKKQLQVPKDEMALIEQKISNEKEEEKSADMGQKQEVTDKGLSSNCEKELNPIKEEKGCDLLDFEIEPLRIQPKLDSTASQQQFRKQVYMENEKDRKNHLEQHHELERKEEIKPEQGQRIMKEMKKSENKEIKAEGKAKQAHKNRVNNQKQKGHRKQNKA